MPLVSVIIPAYNAEAWLGEALQSLIEQSHADWEAIVVDDGSTDGTADVAENFGDARIRVIRQTNSGAATARNVGFAASTGQFIQYLDADDRLDSNKIASQLKQFDDDKTILSGSWAHFHQTIDEAVFRPESVWRDADPVLWLVSSMMDGGMMHPAAWLTPRSLIEKAGPWNEKLSLHDDGEFFSRVLLQAKQIKHVRDARVYYRNVAGSLSRRRSESAAQSALDVCHSYRHHLLLAEDSQRTNIAVAHRYAQVAYEFCRNYPDISEQALGAFLKLAPKAKPRLGGPCFRNLSWLLGFPLALRLRRHWATLI